MLWTPDAPPYETSTRSAKDPSNKKQPVFSSARWALSGKEKKDKSTALEDKEK